MKLILASTAVVVLWIFAWYAATQWIKQLYEAALLMELVPLDEWSTWGFSEREAFIQAVRAIARKKLPHHIHESAFWIWPLNILAWPLWYPSVLRTLRISAKEYVAHK